MTEHKEQEKEAVKNTKTFESNSLNEFNIKNLTDEEKRIAFIELLEDFLPELYSGTILTPNYWYSYYETLAEHQTNYIKSEFRSLKERKDKKIISESSYYSGIRDAFAIQESIEFTTQILSRIVQSTCPIA
jgi:hypothetical protein